MSSMVNPKFLHNINILGVRYGQINSILNNSALDYLGMPLPWYTYPAIEFLSKIDFKNFNILEWGSGNSTFWWSQRAKKVASVEHQEDWYKYVKDGLLVKNIDNVDCFFEQSELAYSEFIGKIPADVLIVDGNFRSKCLKNVLKMILEEKINPFFILFDNSDWYPSLMKSFQIKSKFIQVDFGGFGPINDYTWSTTIFLNPVKAGYLPFEYPSETAGCLKQIASDDVAL